MFERVNIICVGSGFKKTGKTWKALNWISNYAYPKDRSAARKVLIFDTNMEYSAENIKKAGLSFPVKTITENDVLKFNVHPKVEVCRVLPINKDGSIMIIGEKKKLAWNLLQNFRGGLMVLDDINNYVLNVTNEEDFVGTIMNNAHRNQDILINFQSINQLNPVLIRNLDIVRMHYQTDGIDKKFGDRTELYTIAKYIVENKFLSGNKYFNVLIQNHEYKITGMFTKADFALACNKYINKQNQKLIRQEMARLRTKDHIKASAEVIKQLFRYYGN